MYKTTAQTVAIETRLLRCSAPVYQPPPKHSTEGAVVLGTNLCNNLVHAPTIQLTIGQHLQTESSI